MKPNWFVGFPIQSDALAGLYKDAPLGLRAYHLADLHVTVAFFGPADEPRVRDAWAAHVFGVRRTSVVLSFPQLFGQARTATALGLHVESVPRSAHTAFAAAMQSDRDALLASVGRAPDVRDVRPHVTVARLPASLTSFQRRTAIRWAERIDIGDRILLDRVALYTWSDDRERRRFKIVDERLLLAT